MVPIVSEAELSELDKKVLNVVQDELPLVPHPFAALAEKVGSLIQRRSATMDRS